MSPRSKLKDDRDLKKPQQNQDNVEGLKHKSLDKSKQPPKENNVGVNGKPESAIRSILKLRDFKLFWVGESVSLIGDQFYLIALPWLVLTLSGDGLALGTVLGLAAIPRAVFMLIGGAITDRFSPRIVMIVSNVARFVVVSTMAVLALTNQIEIWMVYVFALLFGVADAFFYPAQMSIVPMLVKKLHLTTANSLVMGMTQLAMFIGPVMAGITIAIFVNNDSSITGIGYAFVVDAMTFLVSVIALSLIQTRRAVQPTGNGMIESIRQGIHYIWSDATLRIVIFVSLVVNFLIVGPIVVGIPVIADNRLGGAVDFGAIMTAYGGGALLGILMAGSLPRPVKSFGVLLLVVLGTIGLGLVSMAFFSTTLLIALIAFTMGTATGYVNIMVITWVQSRTKEAMMGRVMSIVMVFSVGMSPMSLALTGVLIDLSLDWMFISFGAALVIFTMSLASIPYIRRLRFELIEA